MNGASKRKKRPSLLRPEGRGGRGAGGVITRVEFLLATSVWVCGSEYQCVCYCLQNVNARHVSSTPDSVWPGGPTSCVLCKVACTAACGGAATCSSGCGSSAASTRTSRVPRGRLDPVARGSLGGRLGGDLGGRHGGRHAGRPELGMQERAGRAGLPCAARRVARVLAGNAGLDQACTRWTRRDLRGELSSGPLRSTLLPRRF